MLPSLRRKLSAVPLGNNRGGVLAFVAVSMVTTLVMAGLAVDVGRGYVLKSQLSRAVDAAALAAARSLREGPGNARKRALAVAAANGVEAGKGNTVISLDFGKNEFDEETVAVTASQDTPTLLMKLIGEMTMDVQSRAVAAVPPVDLVLVLDQSGSLEKAHAWDDLQDAAKRFVTHFDDHIDQIGLVSFNLRAETHILLQQPFTGQAVSAINGMKALGYTNTGEGLRHAFQQFQSGRDRKRSAKVVVFFTDGRPTAYRGIEGNAGDERDRILAAYAEACCVLGYWNDPDDLPIDTRPKADGCSHVINCFQGAGAINRGDVFDNARDNGAFWADRIRNEDVLVYTIGLGDTSLPSGHILQPDQDYLRRLANEDGISNPDQPRGKMYFAPSAAEIRTVFNLVAQDLLARLAH